MRAAPSAAILALLILAVGPARAQIEILPEGQEQSPEQEGAPEPAPPPPPDSAFMTDAQIRATFTGADFRGCYLDGSRWAERTAADGSLYDLLQDGARVGTWWVEDRTICYDYPAMGTTACWGVIRRGGEFYFLFPGTGLVGGTTDCEEPIS